ncbi:hypothetical protein AX15_001109 [Amanita polypyramis BW_CC]|nr:hypothetical protein AX15_001109 [Amanita polypyramis BW_CC]
MFTFQAPHSAILQCNDILEASSSQLYPSPDVPSTPYIPSFFSGVFMLTFPYQDPSLSSCNDIPSDPYQSYPFPESQYNVASTTLPQSYLSSDDSSQSSPLETSLHTSGIENIEKVLKSPARSRSRNHIPRPRNAFMIFRSEFCARERVLRSVERDHRHISRIVGYYWNKLPEEEKDIWRRKAEQEKSEHLRKYPGYRFTPTMRTKRPVKRNVKRNGADDLLRCQLLADFLMLGIEGKDLEDAAGSLEANSLHHPLLDPIRQQTIMSASTIRKPAPRLPQPASRYWKGKAPKGIADVQSDSENEEEQVPHDEGDVPLSGDQYIEDAEEDQMALCLAEQKVVKTMSVSLRDVNISKEGKVIVAGREESGRTLLEEEESDEEDENEEAITKKEGEVEEESSEYESESEEEKPKLQFRPVFIPKRVRETITEKEALAQDSEEALKRKEQETEERRRQSHNMVAESIKRELAEKQKEEAVPDVDDTDGLDPEVEFGAWRLRELARIKKEKEEDILREQEREEIERRRALPEEQRLKEDMERAQKSRDEKPKGQQRFLQKYWHKGAFHQDSQVLKRHDFTEATESYTDMSMLPKVMQVKNFGKRGRTKYTHLLDQDTTAATGGFGGTAPVRSGGASLEGGGCFLCGGPHMKKDCPQNTEHRVAPGGSAVSTEHRKSNRESWRHQNDAPSSQAWRHDESDGSHARYKRPDNYDGRDGRMRRQYSRSRSRSPRGHVRDDRRSRKTRPHSRERIRTDDYRQEKRRRVD